MPQVYLVSLGCARNLVDSEMMLGSLMRAGLSISQTPQQADIIIVNTCSFIDAAVEESIDTILKLARLKQNGACRRLIVTGCLPERFREAIAPALPEVDIFLGTGAFDQISKVIAIPSSPAAGAAACILPDPDLKPFFNTQLPRVRSNPHMAYIKVAEGCSKHCTYCMIPQLRGKQRSRPLHTILTEAEALIASGVKELVLIAQDTSAYGQDLTAPVRLHQLLEHLSQMADDVWIRFLYGHPDNIDPRLIQTVAMLPNICSYFDVPIQHVSQRILKKMGRSYSRSDLWRLFDNLRSAIPQVSLRTTVMLGFPGETDSDFKALLEFVETIRFDHLGGFIYSDADNLPSHHLPGPVPAEIAQERYDQIMFNQRQISLQNNRRRVGETYVVLLDETSDLNYSRGRAFFQAPEVDGVVLAEQTSEPSGSFVKVKITAAREYDLVGNMLCKT